MSLYIVSMSTAQGPYGPTVNMSYHRHGTAGRRAYDECLDSLGADPSTILFVRIDEETMKETVLDFFEGTKAEFDGE